MLFASDLARGLVLALMKSPQRLDGRADVKDTGSHHALFQPDSDFPTEAIVDATLLNGFREAEAVYVLVATMLALATGLGFSRVVHLRSWGWRRLLSWTIDLQSPRMPGPGPASHPRESGPSPLVEGPSECWPCRHAEGAAGPHRG